MKLSNIALALACVASVANANETEWVDSQHTAVKSRLHSWSNNINDWLGETDPSKPATASLRVMLDSQWNRYDGFSIKPRVRGKIKLPVLKKHLNVVFGDDDLDNELRDKNRIGQNYRQLEKDRHYDSRQARNDNASIALRWSNEIKKLGVETDLDGGLRSMGDIYGRLRLSKVWQISEKFSTRLEQIYRYGTKSRHYLRTNLENRYWQTDDTYLMNHTFLQYTHDIDEETGWGNSFYRQHNFTELKRLNYGVFVGGYFEHKKPSLNSYGPFISYRQPIFRKWLFIQPEVNFYNDRDNARSHHLGAFLRLEAIY